MKSNGFYPPISLYLLVALRSSTKLEVVAELELKETTALFLVESQEDCSGPVELSELCA